MAQVWCPTAVRMLKRAGYDEALVVKGCTHVALWCSCLISITFVAVWFSDVFTLRCYSVELGAKKASYWPCIYEFVGITIFFASFRDSVRMIAHFDDDRQRVLRQKWRALELLRTDSQQALESAKANVQRLRGKVVEMMRERVEEYSQEVFTIMIPCLRGEVQRLRSSEGRGPQEAAGFEELLRRLTGLLRDILQDVEDLASGMLAELADEHPEAYHALRSEAQPWEEPLRHWDRWLAEQLPSTAVPSSPPLSVRHGRRSSVPDPDTSGELEPASAVARSVMQPVEELLATPERFERRFQGLLQKSTAGPVRRGQRLGFGTPPWDPEDGVRHRGCRCCLPRFAAIVCTCTSATCCCCCCPGAVERETSCFRSGFVYEPKRLRIGCLWLQIHTKLHERLLQGLLFSIAYCGFYLYVVYRAMEEFGGTCTRHAMKTVQDFRECALGIGRKTIGAVALMVYIPAIAICIYHIDRLDSVMETMNTIWELEDVQKAITAFNRNMAEVADQVVLLRAIEGRVLARVNLVLKFGRKMGALAQPHVADGPKQLRAATQQLVERLETAAFELRPAAEWLRMTQDGQEACLLLASARLEQTGRGSLEAEGLASAPWSEDSTPLMDTATFTAEDP